MTALRCCAIVLIIGAASIGAGQAPAAQRGTIKGHVRVAGKAPGNPIIRMGMDPMCSQMNAGKRVVQETVVASLDGSGVPHAYLTFEGEQHGFRRASTVIAALEAELSFYGQVFGFAPPGVPVLELKS